MKRKISTLAVLLFLAGWAAAQPIPLESDQQLLKKYMNTITVEELKEHLYTIASDDFEGRETGALGQKIAAEYIARHFMTHGLTGPVKDNPNPYYQPFKLYGRYLDRVELRSPNAQLEYGRDFVSQSLSNLELSNTPLVFAGYGIQTDGYDDLSGLDLNGKGVVIINDDPKDKNGDPLLKDAPSSRARLRALSEAGARFVITVFPTQESTDNLLARSGSRTSKPRLSMEAPDPDRGVSNFPILSAGPEAIAALFGLETDDYFKQLNKLQKNGKSTAGLFSTTVDLRFSLRQKEVFTENVLGFLEGTDLKDEIVVITAHYDHVGINDGEVYNGADDDGSGTVGLLEIVDAFAQAAKEGHRPRRSVLFMTVSGEEKGLLGSRYYSDNPVFPLDKTITDLNIDMIGRGDKAHENQPNFVYIIGSTMLSSELHRIHESVAKVQVPDLVLDYKYNTKDDPNRFYYRSDHYNFAKHGIPIIFYFNGTHEDYHRATDTPDKINYPVMANRAKLVFATGWELANREKAPVVDQENTDGGRE